MQGPILSHWSRKREFDTYGRLAVRQPALLCLLFAPITPVSTGGKSRNRSVDVTTRRWTSLFRAASTAIFYILRNYEMKDENYCFIEFTTAKYEIHCFVTERNIAIVEFLSSRVKHLIVIIFVWDETYCLALNNTFRPERQ
jgi:hypothetical protein